MPRRLHVRMTRRAISPRLATRTLLNMRRAYSDDTQSQTWIEGEQIAWVGGHDHPISFARQEDDMRVDRVGCPSRSQHPAQRSGDGVGEIDYERPPQQENDRHLSTSAGAPDLSYDARGRHEWHVPHGEHL